MSELPTYSQYGEDLIVANIFGDFTGRLLDFGAHDPIEKSNSRLLIKRGWTAVLAEFSPTPVRALLAEYGNGDKVQILQAAIATGDHGCLQQFDITDDAVSTADPAIREKWKTDGGYFGKMWVPQITLAHLLNQFGGGFDFVSIDTEGTSVDLAIQYLRELEQRPRVVCVEYDDRLDELLRATLPLGYKNHTPNGTNIILERVA